MKKKAILILILLLSAFLFIQIPIAHATSLYDSNWLYRKSHTINSATGAGTNYQVFITVHYGSGSDSGEDVYLNEHCQSDFDDIRFTDDDGKSLLDYYMEAKVEDDYADFWVEVADDLSSSNQQIYIYYGNNAVSTTSSGYNTFILFDDFNDGSINSTIWSINSGDPDESGGTIKIWHDGTRDKISSKSGFRPNRNCEMFFRSRVSTVSKTGFAWMGWCSSNHWFRLYDSGSTYWYWRTKDSSVDKYSYLSGKDTSFHEWKLRWYDVPSQHGRCIGDGSDKDHTTGVPDDEPAIIVFQAQSSPTAYIEVDWVYVRKYVSPEPTHGAWGDEETEPFYIAFYFNEGGQLRVNCSVANNATMNAYQNGTVLELVAVPQNSSFVFVSFNWSSGSSLTNPHNYSVTSNKTIWLYFADPPAWKFGIEETDFPVLFVGFILCIVLIAFIGYIAYRKKKR